MLDEPAGENLLAASWASGTNSANQQDCSQFRNLTIVNAAILFINKIMLLVLRKKLCVNIY